MRSIWQKLLYYSRYAVLIIILGFSLYSSISYYHSAALDASQVSGDDMVSSWEKRLRKIRPLLPEYGIIGYVADWDIPEYKSRTKDQDVEFLLAQYTLAPLVLERGTNHSVILGNFNDNGDSQKIQYVQNQLGIRLVKQYSNEFFVFERIDK